MKSRIKFVELLTAGGKFSDVLVIPHELLLEQCILHYVVGIWKANQVVFDHYSRRKTELTAFNGDDCG